MKKIILACCLLVVATGFVPAACVYSSFEIAASTDEGIQWLNEHWGENITMGDVVRMCTGQRMSRRSRKTLTPNRLNRSGASPDYWGSRYPWGDEKCNPACPYGAQVWNETGPVRIQDLNLQTDRTWALKMR